ncbi:MAG: DUF116 domain-containing protein [Hyphomicrobiales bacterium]|nr:DUF116 domain-containing protein [Hyphomicrobiales bacterium]
MSSISDGMAGDASRRLDVGVASTPLDLAVGLAWAGTDAAGETGISLRLFRPSPAVAVGRDQAVAREVRLPWCRERGVAVRRRPTGGGALWLDPGQWLMALSGPSARFGADPGERLETAGALLVDAVGRLGVAARFVAPNDVEIDGGAKLASVFLGEAGGRSLLLATLLVDFDVAAALSALLVPTEKLTVTGLEHARERVATLTDRLGAPPAPEEIVAALTEAVATRFDLVARPTETPLPSIAAPAASDDWETPLDDGFETLDRTARATFRLRLRLDPGECVREARFATDAAFVPADLAERLAAALIGRASGEWTAAIAAALRPDDVFVGFTPADLVRLAARAAGKATLAAETGLTATATSGVMLAGPSEDALDALARAEMVLVPYCAKPSWCVMRPTPECGQCGRCSVGEAYRLAQDRDLEVTTITNFEHLSETLADMKARGVTSYVGMCCSDFFRKRHVAFREAGMDAVLMDVVGATCYDLNEEHLAYAGRFQAEAALDLDTLEKVMARVPDVGSRSAS